MPNGRNKPDRLRKPSYTQGRALEITGHAVEYLIDCYVMVASEYSGTAVSEAVQILMQLNITIFEECEEVIPVSQRLWRSLLSFIGAPEEIVILPNKKAP